MELIIGLVSGIVTGIAVDRLVLVPVIDAWRSVARHQRVG